MIDSYDLFGNRRGGEEEEGGRGREGEGGRLIGYQMLMQRCNGLQCEPMNSAAVKRLENGS